jgi:hypothetical protein
MPCCGGSAPGAWAQKTAGAEKLTSRAGVDDVLLSALAMFQCTKNLHPRQTIAAGYTSHQDSENSSMLLARQNHADRGRRVQTSTMRVPTLPATTGIHQRIGCSGNRKPSTRGCQPQA